MTTFPRPRGKVGWGRRESERDGGQVLDMKISFVGGGVMAEALLGGILEAGIASADEIGVGEPLEARRAHLEERYGLKAHPANADALRGADIAVLAVKPQSLPEVMEEIAGGMRADVAVVSIVAGARMDALMRGLKHPAVIRVMPNTPAQIGAGMSVWTAAAEVSGAKIEATRLMLQTLGAELYVTDEKLIDMATALSASGPAYVFMFIESLIDAGVYLGMPRDMARRLTLETVLGSARLVKESGRHPAELKDMVTSPAGTTIEALLRMESSGFRATVMQAVIAAYDRSVALGEKS